MGGSRGATRHSKKSPKKRANPPRKGVDKKALAAANKEIRTTQDMIEKGNAYLEEALDKAIEDGDSREVARLLRGLYARQDRASAQRRRLRSVAAGLAPDEDGGPQDFASLMEAREHESVPPR